MNAGMYANACVRVYYIEGMFVYMNVHICVCMNIHHSMRVCTFVHVYVWTRVFCVFSAIHACMHVCMYQTNIDM